MKKITLLFAFIAFSAVSLFSQSQRLVLAEEFTNASCGPCAGQNPAFDALLQQNTDKITSIKYHMSWPGTDPMYTHNPADNNARKNLYSINGVPHVHVDGNWWNGMPSGVNQYLINTAAAIPSPFDMQVQYELSEDESKINVTAYVNATQNVSGNLKLFLVVIEKHIHFTSPPGYNGEKDFYNVMKKILPTKTGLKLETSIDSGEYFIAESSWELANVYNNDELSVVAFIQDMTTKEVYQAANGSTDPIVPLYTNDVAISGVYYVTDKNCSSKMAPKIRIINSGAAEVTSMDIEYHINDGDVTTINWTGNLAFLDKEEIQLEELNFSLKDTNNFVVEVTNVNGGDDEYVANNMEDMVFYRADYFDGPGFMFLELDNHPEQTTWKMYDYEGNVVQEGGPYTTPGGTVTVTFNFPTSSCYRFEMYDSGNDGLSGGGSYQVAGSGAISFSGGDFTDKDVNEITYDIVGVDEKEIVNNLSIYPNPATDNLSVSFLLSDSKTVSVALYDMLGKQMMVNNMGVQPAGSIDVNFDVNSLQSGVYLIKTEVGNKSYVNKVIVK